VLLAYGFNDMVCDGRGTKKMRPSPSSQSGGGALLPPLPLVLVSLLLVVDLVVGFVPTSFPTTSSRITGRRRGVVECKKESGKKSTAAGGGFGFAKKAKPEFK